ncbi:unnamed protein product, partial [Polarella glacialis]
AREILFMSLEGGKMLCSLAALGITGKEQFTARVVSDTCSVYILKGEDLRDMPASILTQMRAQIKGEMKPLLHYSGAWVGVEGYTPEQGHPGIPMSSRSPRRLSQTNRVIGWGAEMPRILSKSRPSKTDQPLSARKHRSLSPRMQPRCLSK